MTRVEFAAALAKALPAVDAQPLTHRPQYFYPPGPLVRLQVRPPSHALTTLGVLDPVGIVWYAQTGDYRSVLDSPRVGKALGLSDDDLLDLINACDLEAADLGEAALAWRGLVTGVLDAYLSPDP